MINHAKASMRVSSAALGRVLRCRPVTSRSTSGVATIKTTRVISLRSASSAATAATTTVEPQGVTSLRRTLPPSSKQSIGGGGDYILRWGAWCLAGAGVAAGLNRDASGDRQPVAAAAAAGGRGGGTATQELPVRRHAVADAVESASPWVVNVIAGKSTVGGVLKGDANGMRDTGSGFVVSHDGLVVTNAHVVERFVDGTVVITFNGGEQLQGKVQAIDRRFDLALVKVNVPEGRRLPVAAIGRSLTLRAGEFVVAMGSPQGLANTCTLGIVSATARPRSELVADARTENLMSDSTDFIQTDAAIASGNSGGPLIDLDGRVIGINTLKLSGTEGVGFAIPIDTAWQVIEELRTRGRVDRPQLGMRLVTADTRQTRGTGVMVLHVTPGGAADRAGLQFGDLIKEFDGKVVTATSEVLQRIGHEVGRTIAVIIQRDGQAGPCRLTMVTESDMPQTADGAPEAGRSGRAVLGGERIAGACDGAKGCGTRTA